jgi:hypothetical protein
MGQRRLLTQTQDPPLSTLVVEIVASANMANSSQPPGFHSYRFDLISSTISFIPI